MKQQFGSSGLFVLEADVRGCALFGLKEFYAALTKYGVKVTRINHWTGLPPDTPVLVIGTADNRRVQMLLESAGVDYLLPPESLFLKWCDIPGGKALTLAGTDDAGLMYLLLELARKLEVSGLSALNAAEDYTESPKNKVRCVDRYLMGHLDNEWFKSVDFWHYLFGRMARARLNRFCLILGFDTAYMAPPYPYFVESPAYPNVSVKDLSKQGRAENLKMLRCIGNLCHEYGIKFTFATWQQQPWTKSQEKLVNGIPEDEKELGEYCYDGLKNLIRAAPEIDIVQFRVNHESGVGTKISAEDFWNHCADAVAEVANETGRPLILDLRAKGLTDSMIDYAFSLGLAVEVPTKFWCEHAALPYHLSVMRTEELVSLDDFNHSRRYSYADMLKKPRFYDVIYRLWNYGSTNLFLWGDADYARRFSLSCGLSGSAGFQINTPLALKYGYEPSHKEAWKTFSKKELRYGKWEDERFWMWYTVFGRLGYNPDTKEDVWLDEFAKHFGKAGPALEQALAAASKIVPLVTTVHMPIHPSMHYWTEMNTGWALFSENCLYISRSYDPPKPITYGTTEPSDPGLFYGIEEYAPDFLAGKFKGKYSPLQYASWLDYFAAETEKKLAAAENPVNDKNGAEYLALKVDLSMLCDFGRYHAEKIRAAFALALWQASHDKKRLADAALLLDRAIMHWEALSRKGKENYYHDLDFSSRGVRDRRGTWGDLTKELLADRKTLENLLAANNTALPGDLSVSYDPEELPVESRRMSAAFPRTAKAGEPLTVEVKVSGFGGGETPVLHYRHTNQLEGYFKTRKMQKSASGYLAEIPAAYIKAEWDLQVYVTVQGPGGSCTMFPGVYHDVYPYPYHVITVI